MGMQTDPIQQAEKIVRTVNEKSSKYVQPVLKRYPLLFAFLVVFSIAAISHGFKIFIEQFEIFHAHPLFLMFIGILVLIFTGMLYKSLDKGE
jgi:hypothetical protein